MQIINQGFDHVEFIVHDISKHLPMYTRMGFEIIGERAGAGTGLKTVALAQGYVRILLTESDHSEMALKQPAAQFLKAQAEGICVLALEVDNATTAFEETVNRGARAWLEPQKYESQDGIVIRSEIWTPGLIRYAFMERKTKAGSSPILFDKDLVVSRLESPSPFGVRVIDHLTNNVGIGEMKTWVDWYKTIFDFTVTRHFDIRTGRTGLISDVVESRDGRVKVPVNEATEPESQVQEFVKRMKGPGVQHLALLSTGIRQTVSQMRQKGFQFLGVPHTYYEAVPTRVPNVTEDIQELEELGILLDGDPMGYLLQIFTQEMVGPFFFELIQRKNNKGFGEGNFRALFEAIERDQIRRGVLSA